MSFVTTVTVGSTEVTILPGTLVFDAIPVVVVKQNEPCVVTGFRFEGQFAVDRDNAAAVIASTQGAGAIDITISGFTAVVDATLDVQTGGEGIQTKIIKFTGSKTIA